MNWNELHDRIDAIYDAMDDCEVATDCEGLLTTQLAEHLAQARTILRVLSEDAKAREAA